MSFGYGFHNILTPIIVIDVDSRDIGRQRSGLMSIYLYFGLCLSITHSESLSTPLSWRSAVLIAIHSSSRLVIVVLYSLLVIDSFATILS